MGILINMGNIRNDAIIWIIGWTCLLLFSYSICYFKGNCYTLEYYGKFQQKCDYAKEIFNNQTISIFNDIGHIYIHSYDYDVFSKNLLECSDLINTLQLSLDAFDSFKFQYEDIHKALIILRLTTTSLNDLICKHIRTIYEEHCSSVFMGNLKDFTMKYVGPIIKEEC